MEDETGDAHEPDGMPTPPTPPQPTAADMAANGALMGRTAEALKLLGAGQAYRNRGNKN